jgi:hypothetical protein
VIGRKRRPGECRDPYAVPLDVRDAAGRLLRYMTACGYGSLLSQGRRWSWRAFMPPQKMSSSGIAVRRTASLALAYDRTIQYAAGLSVLLLASPEYWIPAFAGMTTENVARVRILQTQLRVPAARCARVVNESFRPGGRGERRVPAAPAVSCALGSGRTHTSNNEHTGIARHSRTQWFYGLFRALPGDRAFLPPSPAELLPPT